MSTPVALNRRFIPWTDKNSRDLEVLTSLSAFRDALTWEDLLARHRVVILAEAGSGKSTELAEQARLSSAAGRYTFSTTVQKPPRPEQRTRPDHVAKARGVAEFRGTRLVLLRLGRRSEGERRSARRCPEGNC